MREAKRQSKLEIWAVHNKLILLYIIMLNQMVNQKILHIFKEKKNDL